MIKFLIAALFVTAILLIGCKAPQKAADTSASYWPDSLSGMALITAGKKLVTTSEILPKTAIAKLYGVCCKGTTEKELVTIGTVNLPMVPADSSFHPFWIGGFGRSQWPKNATPAMLVIVRNETFARTSITVGDALNIAFKDYVFEGYVLSIEPEAK